MSDRSLSHWALILRMEEWTGFPEGKARFHAYLKNYREHIASKKNFLHDCFFSSLADILLHLNMGIFFSAKYESCLQCAGYGIVLWWSLKCGCKNHWREANPHFWRWVQGTTSFPLLMLIFEQVSTVQVWQLLL